TVPARANEIPSSLTSSPTFIRKLQVLMIALCGLQSLPVSTKREECCQRSSGEKGSSFALRKQSAVLVNRDQQKITHTVSTCDTTLPYECLTEQRLGRGCRSLPPTLGELRRARCLVGLRTVQQLRRVVLQPRVFLRAILLV